MKKTALFIARFQPLHKGHVHALNQLFKKYRVVIAIGSVNKKDANNPFSYSQRKRMLEVVLRKYKGKYKIIGIKDFADNRKWTREVERKAKFDVVVSGNNVVRYCFRKYGSKKYKIIKPSPLKPKTYDASAIRKRIIRNKRWEHLVPEEIVPLIIRT